MVARQCDAILCDIDENLQGPKMHLCSSLVDHVGGAGRQNKKKKDTDRGALYYSKLWFYNFK